MTTSSQYSHLQGMVHVRVTNPQARIMTNNSLGRGSPLSHGSELINGACEHTEILSGADPDQAVQKSSVCFFDLSLEYFGPQG